MHKYAVSLALLACLTVGSYGQDTFPELVERAIGPDQELINGIQFSNHYGRIEGHPYLLDGQFHTGSLEINGKWYNSVRVRYNLYTQRPEIEYTTVDGFVNQLMAVPESVARFNLQGIHFERLEQGTGTLAYYQVIAVSTDTCYVSWSKKMGSSTGSLSGNRFNPPEVSFILKVNRERLFFHNRKTLVDAYPLQSRKALNRLIRENGFSFREPTPQQCRSFAGSLIQIYREGMEP